ncbi:MAG: NOG1 family protein [Thermoplasmata archaeon]
MIPERVPSVPTSKELIEKAFKATKRVQDFYMPRFLDKVKSVSVEKVKVMEAASGKTLGKISSGFPRLEDMDAFEKNLFLVLTDAREYERSLDRIIWGKRKIEEIASLSIRSIKRAANIEGVSKARSSFYGRFSSIIEDLSGALNVIRESRFVLRKIPAINREEKVILIAGFPNVGKSSLISRLTNLRPEIAEYPFTTKGINVGIMVTDAGRYQVLDVPGLLNRRNHNEIERIALAALNNIGDLIVCLTDPSGQCGYSISDQRKLCSSLRALGKNLLEVENKLDIVDSGSRNMKISCKTGEGIDVLKSKMEEMLNEGKDKGSGVFQRDSA